MNTDNSPDQILARSQPGRWVRLALIVSVALNLLVAGAIAGRILSGPGPGPMPRHLGWITQSLDAPTRQAIAPLLRDNRQSIRPLHRAMGQAQQRFHQVLEAKELDQQALAAALNDIQGASATYQRALHSQMISVLTRLDHDQRRQVADFLQQHRPGAAERRAGRNAPPP